MPSFTFETRPACLEDCERISEIYNRGIEQRTATFETVHRSSPDIARWFDGLHPTIVCVANSVIIGFATTSEYSSRACYSGIAEFSVYMDEEYQGKGLGKKVMEHLIAECVHGGFWKLVSRIFVENTVSRELMRSLGFREVGVYEKHGKINGEWKDVVIVERLLTENLK